MKGRTDRTGLMLLCLTAACVGIFVAGGAALLLLPVNAYWYASGTVVYQDQKWLSSDFDGVISTVNAGEGAWLRPRDTLVSFRNRELIAEANLTAIRLASTRELLAKYLELRGLGYLDGRLISEKEAEIKQLEVTLKEQRDGSYESAFEGKLRFVHPPRKLLGRFVRKGEVLGVVSKDTTKSIEIAVGLEYADRIPLGTPVKIYYKSVSDYASRKFDTKVTGRHLEVEENRLLLACDTASLHSLLGGLETMDIGTRVEARILVDKASFLDRLFRRKITFGQEDLMKPLSEYFAAPTARPGLVN